MKKFDRLPPESRKEEIRKAASTLFIEKGFRATTMENIVANVSLSKGGVYRIYSSTTAILSDIILEGMRTRNRFYLERAQMLLAEGHPLTVEDIVDIICDSMLLLPEVSSLYAEFLIEKRRNPEMEMLYRSICEDSMQATDALLKELKLPLTLEMSRDTLWKLTDLMNTTILGVVVLERREDFDIYKEAFRSALLVMIKKGNHE